MGGHTAFKKSIATLILLIGFCSAIQPICRVPVPVAIVNGKTAPVTDHVCKQLCSHINKMVRQINSSFNHTWKISESHPIVVFPRAINGVPKAFTRQPVLSTVTKINNVQYIPLQTTNKQHANSRHPSTIVPPTTTDLAHGREPRNGPASEQNPLQGRPKQGQDNEEQKNRPRNGPASEQKPLQDPPKQEQGKCVDIPGNILILKMDNVCNLQGASEGNVVNGSAFCTTENEGICPGLSTLACLLASSPRNNNNKGNTFRRGESKSSPISMNITISEHQENKFNFTEDELEQLKKYAASEHAQEYRNKSIIVVDDQTTNQKSKFVIAECIGGKFLVGVPYKEPISSVSEAKDDTKNVDEVIPGGEGQRDLLYFDGHQIHGYPYCLENRGHLHREPIRRHFEACHSRRRWNKLTCPRRLQPIKCTENLSHTNRQYNRECCFHKCRCDASSSSTELMYPHLVEFCSSEWDAPVISGNTPVHDYRCHHSASPWCRSKNLGSTPSSPALDNKYYTKSEYESPKYTTGCDKRNQMGSNLSQNQWNQPTDIPEDITLSPERTTLGSNIPTIFKTSSGLTCLPSNIKCRQPIHYSPQYKSYRNKPERLRSAKILGYLTNPSHKHRETQTGHSKIPRPLDKYYQFSSLPTNVNPADVSFHRLPTYRTVRPAWPQSTQNTNPSIIRDSALPCLSVCYCEPTFYPVTYTNPICKSLHPDLLTGYR